MIETPRLRMFAGPNGSGKSTIKDVIPTHQKGVYINPDDIESNAKEAGAIYFEDYSVYLTGTDIERYFYQSPLTLKASLAPQLKALAFEDNCIKFPLSLPPNSYIASIASALIREQLTASKISFTFETVMSSEDKIEVLKASRAAGFKNYLYYIATDDPAINVQRVHNRVKTGGHPVPEEKIRQRYDRSIDLLLEAIKLADRAFIFDNSGSKDIWLAEVTPGGEIQTKVEELPNWFYSSVIEKLCPPSQTT
ncbi:zeta toxin family protein [Vreelandella zhanjiangensis]|uniref:zeta toxin family protein n=1 Tax=Vreelandella zhanjiangensis TaxID=1121960 RepID=UPI0003731CE3|nr:zeta toxin family protein [Halomonas zhanjiangensis]